MNVHIKAGPIREVVWPLSVSRSKLEGLNHGHSKEVHLGAPENLTGTAALSDAKVDDLLIGHKLSLCIDEPLRLEGGRVLKEVWVMKYCSREIVHLKIELFILIILILRVLDGRSHLGTLWEEIVTHCGVCICVVLDCQCEVGTVPCYLLQRVSINETILH